MSTKTKKNVNYTKEDCQSNFYKYFQDFMDFLSEQQPGDMSLILLQNATKCMTYNMIITQFMSIVGDYEEHIINENEDFFLNDLPKQLGNTYFEKLALDELKKVSSIWVNPDTTQETKDELFFYLKKLIKWGKRFHRYNIN